MNAKADIGGAKDMLLEKRMCFYAGAKDRPGHHKKTMSCTYPPPAAHPDHVPVAHDDTLPSRRYFVCAKATGTWDDDSSEEYIPTGYSSDWEKWTKNWIIGSSWHLPARKFDVKARRYTGAVWEDYSKTMRKGCAEFGEGWKPVCAGGNNARCHNSKDSIYFGQKSSVSIATVYKESDVPAGMPTTNNNGMNMWRLNGICLYTGGPKGDCAETNGSKSAYQSAPHYRSPPLFECSPWP